MADPLDVDSDYGGRGDRTAAKADRGNFRLDAKHPRPSIGVARPDAMQDGPDQDQLFQAKARADRLGLPERGVGSSAAPFDEPPANAADKRGDASSAVDSLSAADSNFGRRSYVDLLIGDDFGAASMNELREPLTDRREESGDDRLYDEKKNYLDKEKDREKIILRKNGQDLNYEELIELYASPPPVGPNHWVPDKLDPIQTGAFTTSPDNGSPVPYRLNGHVDLERSTPWLLDHDSLPEKLLH